MSTGTPTYDEGRPWEGVPEPDSLEMRLIPGNPARLLVAGEIDLSNSARFEQSLGVACGSAESVVVDLTGLVFISSAGIGSLYRHSERIAAVLVSEPSLIYRALAYAGFTGRVPVIPAN